MLFLIVINRMLHDCKREHATKAEDLTIQLESSQSPAEDANRVFQLTAA